MSAVCISHDKSAVFESPHAEAPKGGSQTSEIPVGRPPGRCVSTGPLIRCGLLRCVFQNSVSWSKTYEVERVLVHGSLQCQGTMGNGYFYTVAAYKISHIFHSWSAYSCSAIPKPCSTHSVPSGVCPNTQATLSNLKTQFAILSRSSTTAFVPVISGSISTLSLRLVGPCIL